MREPVLRKPSAIPRTSGSGLRKAAATTMPKRHPRRPEWRATKSARQACWLDVRRSSVSSTLVVLAGRAIGSSVTLRLRPTSPRWPGMLTSSGYSTGSRSRSPSKWTWTHTLWVAGTLAGHGILALTDCLGAWAATAADGRAAVGANGGGRRATRRLPCQVLQNAPPRASDKRVRTRFAELLDDRVHIFGDLVRCMSRQGPRPTLPHRAGCATFACASRTVRHRGRRRRARRWPSSYQ